MNPQHKNPTEPRVDRRGRKHWARAPYNFVPLPEPEQLVKVVELPHQDVYAENTGWIECDLETNSPLYIRGTLGVDQFAQGEEAKNQPDFFSVGDGRPTVPGSTLRGAIRTLVEIAGYGKIQWVTNERLVFRSVGDTTSLGDFYRRRLMHEDGNRRYTPLMQAGHLERDGADWQIRPAVKINGTTFARIRHSKIPKGLERWKQSKNARHIWVQLGAFDYQPVRGGYLHIKYTPVLEASASAKEGFEEGVLAYSGEMDKKSSEAVIFKADVSAQPIKITSEMVRAYRDQISKEQQTLLDKDGALVDGQPVFYLVEQGQLVFFGHVMMFRLPYGRAPFDFLPEDLRQEVETDLSEAIFGYTKSNKIPSGKERAYGGRVFFSDARFQSARGDIWLSPEPITPKILGTPKPTTFQHYLTQQQPDLVDTGHKQKDGTAKMEARLDHYASPPPHPTVIRGHKFYWHKGEMKEDDIVEDKPVDWSSDTQHTRIRPVNSGVSFHFRVHFENLRDYELGALLWALKLPGEPGVEYRHSIGMGKPLGMGAVKITPTLWVTDRAARYRRLFNGGNWDESSAQVEAQPFVEAFEKYVLKVVAPDKTRLAEVERIKMLLEMLKWPGPNREWTRYMEIEHPQNGNEYKERPVLPDPLHIEPKNIGQPKSLAPKPMMQPGGQPKPKLPLAKKPTDPILFKPGDSVRGEVFEVQSDGTVLIELDGIPDSTAIARIQAANVGSKKYSVGNPARCEVIEVVEERPGRWLIECKPGAKKGKEYRK